MMRYSYIPAPHSIYKGIFKLEPATVLSLPAPFTRGLTSPVQYWSAKSVYEAAATEPFSGSDDAATRALDTVLRRAVADQMIGDVPVGAFLSGGIDSSLIVSLMQAQAGEPVRTFTIGSYDNAYNEAENAKRIARHLGTNHTELYVSADDALAVIPTLPAVYDEPFADPSQIPTCLLSRLTRQHVTVSLSGDGGDELFCGYHRYRLLQQLWRRVDWMPPTVRGVISRSLAALAPAVRSLEHLEPVMPRVVHRFGVRLPKRVQWLTSHPNPEALYRDVLSHWKSPSAVVTERAEAVSALTDSAQWASLPHLLERAMFIDLIGYLPDDILVKVDRAAMSVGLESRAPFLDHRVVEFAARLPLSLKMRGGHSKWLLREVLRQYVPDALVEGPKRGFLVGFSQWLRGPLRDWAEALLDETRLRNDGFFDPSVVRAKWLHYLAVPSSPWNNDLWNILMFQSWLDHHQQGRVLDDCHPAGRPTRDHTNQRLSA
jgi:asparagine synthase (glutamine-hydrolysing)